MIRVAVRARAVTALITIVTVAFEPGTPTLSASPEASVDFAVGDRRGVSDPAATAVECFTLSRVGSISHVVLLLSEPHHRGGVERVLRVAASVVAGIANPQHQPVANSGGQRRRHARPIAGERRAKH